MKKIIIISLLLISYMGFSQSSGIGINSTGVNPDPSAGLDVDFNDKGILIPRLTTNQRDGIQNTAIGLQVYNTTENCLQIFMPLSGWRDVSCDCQMSPSSSAFTFTDSLSNNSNVVFTAITAGFNYSWMFQNGTPSTSNLQTDTVVWASPGTYAVTLTVTDNVGCTASTTDSITILACPPPLALNFTNCTQTGRTGPSQGQCNSAYSGTPLANNVTVTSGIQEWTVPATGTYQIEAAGAKGGGSNNFGKGAIVSGKIALNQGDVLKILVGQQGGAQTSGSGGGGSFVAISNTPLIVAGGGGGQYTTSSALFNADGSTGNSGGGSGCGSGGTNGNGGAGCGNNGASAGGGFSGNGTSGTYGTGGLSFLNGGIGGDQSSYPACVGGFGGAGGTHGNSGGGGGGGGYSGGGGGWHDANTGNGGGGGSFIAVGATNISTSDGQYNGNSTFNGNSITNLSSYNSGHGYVNITLICP